MTAHMPNLAHCLFCKAHKLKMDFTFFKYLQEKEEYFVTSGNCMKFKFQCP